MDHLLEAYASSSSEDEKIEEKDPNPSVLGGLPSELLTIFKDSASRHDSLRAATEYDLATERRRAEERAGNIRWVRRFPHERGNWPTHVFIPVPNSAAFKSMAEASVSHFRQRLATAWREGHGRAEGGKGGKKRTRDGRQRSNQASASSAGKLDPPEVVMNDMDPSGRQHLSLSKTTALRAHQINPFVRGLKEAVKSSRSFTASFVSGYDVLVNEDKTRSFVCLRVRGGRQMVLSLIAKVDPLMRRFKQSEYYEVIIMHEGDRTTSLALSMHLPTFAALFVHPLTFHAASSEV
ncbi:similar to Chromosome 16 open reading frame 57 [Ectocarpus siliculosus]|uniref:U6 snRNA phosphodiesterase 1 n=1 Tax=Ectocarpus siliculosus TaxID=2880 RepID=D7FRL4_ECTSI|nr:similar to Chromosome 16 open reading frame 57 [Ectocarpus siliculosus]|eukprot:CBJ30805.1 similar to Chromosome 16 open reading frame 57 [Ectocarpus siliculosus]